MKSIKEIAVIMAIFGASIGLNAQTNDHPANKKATNKTGTYQEHRDKKAGNKTGMSQSTYQQTPDKQDKTAVVIPEAVKVSFNNDYYTKDIIPVWRKQGENYRVEFKNGSIGSVAIYDKNGKLIESERQLGDGEYPEGISNYSQDKTAKVWESNRDGEIKYFTKDDNGHMTWFDKDGKHISSPEHHIAHHARAYK